MLTLSLIDKDLPKKRLAVHDLIKNLNLNTPYNAGFAERIIEIKSIKN
jgi:hypothetical protein